MRELKFKLIGATAGYGLAVLLLAISAGFVVASPVICLWSHIQTFKNDYYNRKNKS